MTKLTFHYPTDNGDTVPITVKWESFQGEIVRVEFEPHWFIQVYDDDKLTRKAVDDLIDNNQAVNNLLDRLDESPSVMQICYSCKRVKVVQEDDPYHCQCGVWNQSEQFKAKLRRSISTRGRRALILGRQSSKASLRVRKPKRATLGVRYCAVFAGENPCCKLASNFHQLLNVIRNRLWHDGDADPETWQNMVDSLMDESNWHNPDRPRQSQQYSAAIGEEGHLTIYRIDED